MLVVDLLLKGDEHVAQLLAEVEAGLAAVFDAHGLQLCDIEHVAHEPREPAHLAGDDLHVMLLLFRRDRPVEHAVDVAADGGHRRFEFMRDVRHEFLPPLLGFFKRVGHGVEGVG